MSSTVRITQTLGRLTCAVALLVLFRPTLVCSQEPAMSASLARLLAEAADGYRTGRHVWFVSTAEAPYDLQGAFPSAEDAQMLARSLGASYRVYGPYLTPLDFDRSTIFVPILHFRPTIIPDDPVQGLQPEVPVPIDSLERVQVIVHGKNGLTYEYSLDPQKVDALFLTLSAVDKFVLPYYAGVRGVEYARALRERIRLYIVREGR